MMDAREPGAFLAAAALGIGHGGSGDGTRLVNVSKKPLISVKR